MDSLDEIGRELHQRFLKLLDELTELQASFAHGTVDEHRQAARNVIGEWVREDSHAE